MTAPTHMLTGLYLIATIPDPSVSLPAAFVSHYVLDFVPHNDYIYFYIGKKWEDVNTSPLGKITVFLGFVLLAFFSIRGTNPLLLFSGGMAAVAPDAIDGLFNLLGFKPNFLARFHRRIHTASDLGEVFYRRCGGEIVHTEDLPQWRENFNKLKKSMVANLGWGIELLFELLFLSVIIYNLVSLT